MNRGRALKILLVLVGLLFSALVIPMFAFLRPPNRTDSLPMMLSLYVTLGILLLLAARNPSANRSLIAFTVWSSFAHAAVMVVQAFHDPGQRVHLLVGVAALVVIAIAFILLAPDKQPGARESVAAA
jgi:glucose uptake protein GlcU